MRTRVERVGGATACDGGLPAGSERGNPGPMWNDPYLETCCRSALHRLSLCDERGRPDGTRAELKDARCLDRLEHLGFAVHVDDCYRMTEAGVARHDREIMKVA